MNILPKKSWHVLNKQNIERVRRDEAKARAEEEEKASRASLAEQEAKLGTMRKRARKRDGVEEVKEEGGGRSERGREGRKEKREECSVTDASGHINFFADLQKGVGLQVGNVEREKEMKQEQEKLEKRIGLLNYLVDKDKSDTVPWYVKSGATKSCSGRAAAEEVEAKRQSAKAQHRKELQDPLLEMRGHLKTKRKREEMAGAAPRNERRGGLSSGKSGRYRESTSSETREKPSDKHSKREHKKKKEKEKKREKMEDELERLRRERRKREEGERVRSEALMRGLQGGGGRDSQSESQAVEQAPGRYNSQFNPHLARQRQQH